MSAGWRKTLGPKLLNRRKIDILGGNADSLALMTNRAFIPSLKGFLRVFAFAQRRRLAVFLGLAVMVFNLLGGIVLPMGGLPMGRTAVLAGADAQTITICTQSGMVDIPASGTHPDQSPHGPHRGLACAFCLPLMHGGAVSVGDVGILSQPTAFNILLRLDASERVAPKPVRLAGLNAPRAPPIS